ncbi:F-box/FBD/LRR-repeat protein At4g26340-like [Trifolium pratense]|uniref:F-box/FBD/LRR-repeat protein At4g26340-like n=1 Tax=Trifolium pratense TaxID=57577 RepID=UPI001E69019E|nr:F-box/FBD/LRR-repeat protein At4g26340-like [Trifolium pratense]XP_045790564.1 F-box/FBD/LRR-repeat protein At4g26340-like [Trifolium pratense]
MVIIETITQDLSSKRGKLDEDRISTLPEDVRSKILSFLPTKTAVATSLLSPKWRYFWQQHLSVLDFDDDSFEPNEDRFELFKTFAVFVNSVFLLRKPCHVHKMTLSCIQSLVDDKFCFNSVNTWVRSVIGPHLNDLHLTLYSDDGYCFEPPINLSSCINLLSLSLEGAVYFNLQRAKGIRLPSLKKLHLDIGYVLVTSVSALLSGCPILETLDLYFETEEYGILCVPPSLKKLKMRLGNGNSGASFEIDAPGLKYLDISEFTFGNVGNLQHVVEASLNIHPPPGAFAYTLVKLLDTLSGVKHLVLCLSTTKWLLSGPTDLRFPEFQHLLHLELILPWFNSNCLLSLLQTCHLLQVLIIENHKEQSPLPRWAAHPSVPSCLVSHLTFVQLKGYRGSRDELLFAKYILQKGLILKTVIIVDISADIRKKFDNLKRLSDVPRASGMCRLTYD